MTVGIHAFVDLGLRGVSERKRSYTESIDEIASWSYPQNTMGGV